MNTFNWINKVEVSDPHPEKDGGSYFLTSFRKQKQPYVSLMEITPVLKYHSYTCVGRHIRRLQGSNAKRDGGGGN